MEAQTNTQMPQPACHLSVDRRNTPATSSQSAFHHSVTTCQLQSPSLRHTALIFTNCAAAWDTTQPCQKYDTGRITLLHLLIYTHPLAHAEAPMHIHVCVCIHDKFSQCVNTSSEHSYKSHEVGMCVSHILLLGVRTVHELVHIAIRLKNILFMWLDCLRYLISGTRTQPPVSQNDRQMYWLIDSANSAYIHFINPSHKLHSKITIQHPLTFTPLRQRAGDLG